METPGIHRTSPYHHPIAAILMRLCIGLNMDFESHQYLMPGAAKHLHAFDEKGKVKEGPFPRPVQKFSF